MNAELPQPCARSWLDIEIQAPPNFEILRWKWLGLLVIAGATIPPESFPYDGDRLFLTLMVISGFISFCWHRSPVAIKAAVAIGAGLTVYVHRKLPLPAISHGFYAELLRGEISGATWQFPSFFLPMLAISAVTPMLSVVTSHYLILFYPKYLVMLQALRRMVWPHPNDTAVYR